MGRKILFIGFKRQDSILIGGGMANARSLRMLEGYFGSDNVCKRYILDEAVPRNIWSYMLAVLLLPFYYHNGLTPKKVKRILEEAKSFDYVFLSTSVIAIIAKKLKENGYKGRIITHYHNVESIYYDAQVPRYMPGRSLIVKCAAHNDAFGCKYSDKIITLSQRDSIYLEKHYGRGADAVVSVSMEDKFQPVDEKIMTGKRPKCLFVGAYSIPNNDGVLFFVKQVLPYVDVDFKVVGRNMVKLKEENSCMKDIEVVNDAIELRPYFEEADFMILPVFSGSGMKVKTCESLMYGKNIIGTKETFEGYNLDTDKVGGLCNNSKEFIDRINYFIHHPVTRYNPYAREVFLRNNSEESTQSVFCSVF